MAITFSTTLVARFYFKASKFSTG